MAALAVHVQRRLRGRPRHRDVLGGQAAQARPAASTRACRPRARASTSGRASSSRPQHPFQVNPPSGVLVNWNNRPAPGVGRGRRQLVLRLRRSACGCSTTAWPSAPTHDLASVTVGDERGGDAGPAQRRADAGASPSCSTARAGAVAAGDAHARAARWRGARRARRRLDRDLDGMMDAGPAPGDLGRVLPEAVRRPRCPVEGLEAFVGHDSGPSQRLHRRRLLVPREGPAHAQRRRSSSDPFNDAVLRRAANRAKCAAAVWKALDAVPGDPDALTARRERGADRVPARAAADHDPLHEPPERDPAGDLVRTGHEAAAYGLRQDLRHDAEDDADGRGRSAAVLAHAALDDRVLAARSMWNMNVFEPPIADRRRRSGWRRR